MKDEALVVVMADGTQPLDSEALARATSELFELLVAECRAKEHRLAFAIITASGEATAICRRMPPELVRVLLRQAAQNIDAHGMQKEAVGVQH